MTSPYYGLPIEQWQEKTLELIKSHPLDANELYSIVLSVWDDIFKSHIGSRPFRIGVDLFPRPQIMGFFLHELIPVELAYRYKDVWRREQSSHEKDLVYIPDEQYSIEMKTSSSGRNIYGNRSYAQESKSARKNKSGYYLAINFQNFTSKIQYPRVELVRFGWLDHEDWIGQSAATGQQARLSPIVERNKLLSLPLVEYRLL